MPPYLAIRFLSTFLFLLTSINIGANTYSPDNNYIYTLSKIIPRNKILNNRKIKFKQKRNNRKFVNKVNAMCIKIFDILWTKGGFIFLIVMLCIFYSLNTKDAKSKYQIQSSLKLLLENIDVQIISNSENTSGLDPKKDKRTTNKIETLKLLKKLVQLYLEDISEDLTSKMTLKDYQKTLKIINSFLCSDNDKGLYEFIQTKLKRKPTYQNGVLLNIKNIASRFSIEVFMQFIYKSMGGKERVSEKADMFLHLAFDELQKPN